MLMVQNRIKERVIGKSENRHGAGLLVFFRVDLGASAGL